MNDELFLYNDEDLLNMANVLLNETGLSAEYTMYLITSKMIDVGIEFDMGIAIQKVPPIISLPFSVIIKTSNIKNSSYAEEVPEWQYYETSDDNGTLKLQKIGAPSVLSKQMKMMVMSVTSYQIDLQLMTMKALRGISNN